MKPRQLLNIVVVVAVVGLVGGVAWYRQSNQPVDESALSGAGDENLPRLVDVGSDKCVACQKLAPILEELRKEYKGRVAVEFIDAYKHPSAMQIYGVRAIPTQILYDRNDDEVWRHEGFISKEDLAARFAEVGVK